MVIGTRQVSPPIGSQRDADCVRRRTSSFAQQSFTHTRVWNANPGIAVTYRHLGVCLTCVLELLVAQEAHLSDLGSPALAWHDVVIWKTYHVVIGDGTITPCVFLIRQQRHTRKRFDGVL